MQIAFFSSRRLALIAAAGAVVALAPMVAAQADEADGSEHVLQFQSQRSRADLARDAAEATQTATRLADGVAGDRAADGARAARAHARQRQRARGAGRARGAHSVRRGGRGRRMNAFVPPSAVDLGSSLNVGEEARNAR